MAAEDELALPQVPEAKPEDPEDVSWALSTAEAMWARGDHLEGIKWVRKAAEAASDVEDDNRALELAKAASDLTTALSHRPPPPSRPASGPPPVPGAGSPSGGPGAPPPMPATLTASSPTAYSLTPSAPPVVPAFVASRPPPVPAGPAPGSKPSQPPRAPQAAPAPHAQPPRAAPRTLATGPQVGKGILSNRVGPESGPASSPTLPGGATAPKARRRSRENLENEARAAAGVTETARLKAMDSEGATRTLGGRGSAEPDPTIVGRFADLQAERRKSAAEWDASPTQNFSGDVATHVSHDHETGDRMTAFEVPLAPAPAPTPSARPPQAPLHDPGIQTSQAVRVVVWRDTNGVHVAPAGTVVSAITIDAVLVVLEPTADLTAWLSQRER